MTTTRLLIPLYAGALFVAALLLFGVQPLVVKMALPSLGGSPAVWNTAQVFFQVLLLGGYLYAHLLARLPGTRLTTLAHVAVLIAAFTVLPVSLPTDWQPPTTGSPIPSLLGALAGSVGLPFFAVATTAPLMQSWFARTGDAAAADPYFLYSASNLGGLAALLGYPFVLAPAFGLVHQSELWTAAYALLVVLIAIAGLTLPSRPSHVVAVDARSDDDPAPSWWVRGRWTLLAFAPSSLMLGVTLHISTDVAAAPFLWVLPLALYLLSWVITFARRPLLPHRWMLAAQPVALASLIVFFDSRHLAPAFLLHLGAFFVNAMVCHGELARTRPKASRLTEFYLWISLGGVLGGAFSGVLAPLVFDAVLEYPIALVLACALRPRSPAGSRAARVLDFALPIVLALAYLGATWATASIRYVSTDVATAAIAVGVGVLLWTFHERSVRFALAVALVLVVAQLDLDRSEVLAQERSFFGVHRVLADSSGEYRLLTHGDTIHGVQRFHPTLFREPLAYYAREGPVGQVFDAFAKLRPHGRIGVVGLGSGALTCYRNEAQPLTYFEIDPTVVRLAADPRYLLFLAGCGQGVKIAFGDGRRTLATLPDAGFELIVLDAFSSDAIPAHLLTVEAMTLYARKLAPGGVLLLHLSNRHLDLTRVAAATAAAAGLETRLQTHTPRGEAAVGPYRWKSTWMLCARSDADLAPYAGDEHWRVPERAERPWTDDYSNVAAALKWDGIW